MGPFTTFCAKVVRIFSKIKHNLLKGASAVFQAFGVREIFMLSGLGLLGYGLWLFMPWIGFSVPGGLMLAMGYLMEDVK